MSRAAGNVEVYRDEVGEWRWRRRAANGEVIAQGEGYARRIDALATVADLYPSVPILEIDTATERTRMAPPREDDDDHDDYWLARFQSARRAGLTRVEAEGSRTERCRSQRRGSAWPVVRSRRRSHQWSRSDANRTANRDRISPPGRRSALIRKVEEDVAQYYVIRRRPEQNRTSTLCRKPCAIARQRERYWTTLSVPVKCEGRRGTRYRNRLRNEALAAYGNRCRAAVSPSPSFCASITYTGVVQSIVARRALKARNCTAASIKSSSFPPSFRVLCHNCRSFSRCLWLLPS